MYGLQSDTSEGFQLCPADACDIPAQAPEVCPTDGVAKFSPSPLVADDPLVQQYLGFCAAEGLEIAGIEFVEDDSGQRFSYDVNGTTNYNSAVGEQLGIDGMREIARYLKRLLG